MADLSTSELTEVPAGIEYYPEGASVDKLILYANDGREIELKKMLIEFNYYEDIYSFVVSGSVSLRDGQGLVETFQLTGNEFLEVDFGRVKDSENNTSRKFRIYKLGNRTPIGNLNSEVLTLHFCSEELLLSEQKKITRSYNGNGGQEIWKTVEQILTNELQVTKEMDIELTTGLHNFIVPRLKPFEAISWLSTYAKPASQELQGADMLFFENKNGFNFKSLRTLFEEDPYDTYVYQQNNTDSTPEEKARAVLQFEFVKSFDMLNEISSGTYANRLISVDPQTRSYKITDFSYDNYTSNVAKPMNGSSVLQDSKNRFGQTQSNSFESVVKVVIGNSGSQTDSYISNIQGSVAKDISVENFVPYRTAQMALANHTVVKIVVPGDPELVAGSTIVFNIFSLKTVGERKELDHYYSGKYLVSACRHVLQSSGIYQTILEIVKESYGTELQPMVETPDLKAAANE